MSVAAGIFFTVLWFGSWTLLLLALLYLLLQWRNAPWN